MRQLSREQLTLSGPVVNHPHAQELEGVDRILRANPDITELVLQDLAREVHRDDGREGMTAEQVLRAALLKQINTFAYDELAFHLLDSATYRAFSGLGVFDPAPSKSTLQRNIKSLTEQTWEAINRKVLGYAAEQGVEKGRKVRIDATVTEANIHYPSDSSLLWDSVRVLTRLLAEAHERHGVARFPKRTRRAKRRALEVLNAKGARKQRKAYRDLLAVTSETVGYARSAVSSLESQPGSMGSMGAMGAMGALALAAELSHYVVLAEAVIDQTERRVLHGEEVPATEKLVSVFEDHTDVIIKDKRDTHFGHKLTVTGGRSGLILDWVVEDGNPADSTLAIRMLARQKDIYGQVPRQAAFDGGFASKLNLEDAKVLGIKDVSFSKKRGLEVLDMVKSQWVYKRLRNFRAGIESWISLLKRSFGLERCTWKGWAGFARYVGASIVAANLLTLARRLAA
jgi:IS5 family transposase